MTKRGLLRATSNAATKDEYCLDHLQHMPSPCPPLPEGSDGTGLVLEGGQLLDDIAAAQLSSLLGYQTHQSGS